MITKAFFFHSLKGYIRNVHINGLSNFDVDDVKFHVAGFEFALNISLPKVVVSGEYASKGHIGELFNLDSEDKFEYDFDINMWSCIFLRYF